MAIVVIDLIPALLTWEGRDRSARLTIAPDGPEAVAHLHSHYRVAGITDAGVPNRRIRDALDSGAVTSYFDSIGTSAGFGPEVNARVVRRLTMGAHGREQIVFVTGREPLARAMNRSRMGVVITTAEDFGGVPEAVATLVSGRVSP